MLKVESLGKGWKGASLVGKIMEASVPFLVFFFFGWQFLIGFAENSGLFLLGTNIFSPKV